MIDQNLMQFATPAQLRIIEAVIEFGSERKAAKALGFSHGTISNAIKRVKKSAARSGYAPEFDMVRQVPDGYTVKGVSTYYNKDGKPVGQWVKSSADAERREELIREAYEAMATELPRLEPIVPPQHAESTLCNLFTLTDCHVGMLAWHQEGGDDWDIGIAEDVLVRCFSHMVTSSPAADVCFVNQLGDFLHSDGMMPVTPTSGHILDTDGRFSKIVQAAVRILRRVIDIALSRHNKVVVLMGEGNHDLASSIWLRAMFKALYENEPRVEIIDSELPYYAYQHGKTMLAFHHGHLSKNDNLPLLFAAQFPLVWGLTAKRYCHTGHRHHVEEKEHPGMTVVQHPTLAARDAYAARGGWISDRQATAITYHSAYGQVARNTVTPEMVA